MNNIDFLIFQQINQYAGRWVYLDSLGVFLAQYLQYFVVLFLLFFLAKDIKKYGKMVVGSLAAAIVARLGIVVLIRLLWERPRPFVDYHVNQLINYSNSSSFPSGHASFFFAMAAAIYFYGGSAKTQGIFFFFAAFLISFSRIFVGIHWPSDILAGAAIGIFSGWVVNKIFDKFAKNY